MQRATIFVAGFVAIAACANDFDALTKGSATEPDDATRPSSTSSGSSGDKPPIDATDCAAKQCQPTISTKDGQRNLANECCSYTTSCGDLASCQTLCSNGAICSGSCENSAECAFTVTGAKGSFACTSSDCTLECNGKSTCALDCTSSASCDVTCDATSTCVVTSCGDTCTLTCGDGKPAMICAKGVQACGACPK